MSLAAHVAIILAGCLVTTTRAIAQPATGSVKTTVFITSSNGERSPMPGAQISISRPSVLQQAIADERGIYRFTELDPGEYKVEAVAPGLAGEGEAVVSTGAETNVSIELKAERVMESVTVTADADSLADAGPADQSTVSRSVVLNAPNKDDRVDSALPLIPGVVRGPDGLINMKGARSSQGGALVNSANVTDPVTGNPAMSLPIDVVQSVTVVSNPYDPEYGRLTGAVSSVETATGNFDAFHFTVQNLIARPRSRGGDIVGIESFTPRLSLTGPLIKNKVAITQSFEYRFIRTPVSSLPPLSRDLKFEGLTSFTQVDVSLTSRQSLTATFTLYPQKLNYLGLNTFDPQPSTPDLHQRGYMASVQHRDTISAESVLVSQLSYKRFNADVTANSSEPYDLWLETTTGGFFDRQRRESARTEWQETYQFEKTGLLGRTISKSAQIMPTAVTMAASIFCR